MVGVEADCTGLKLEGQVGIEGMVGDQEVLCVWWEGKESGTVAR